MKYYEVLKKHGFELCDNDKIYKFRTTIKNILNAFDYYSIAIPGEVVFRICQATGCDNNRIHFNPDSGYNASSFFCELLNMNTNLYMEQDDFVNSLAVLSTILQDKHFTKKEYKPLVRAIKEGFDNFCLPYSLVNGVIIPKGEKLFDDNLIADVMEWLLKYPETYSIYVTGLQQYFNNIPLVADTMRKALETFLQEFLSNDANLETNIPRIGTYLKSQNVGDDLRNMLTTLITHYKGYNDKNDKHHKPSDPKLWEFLLYQTGLFIRMIITVKVAEV